MKRVSVIHIFVEWREYKWNERCLSIAVNIIKGLFCFPFIRGPWWMKKAQSGPRLPCGRSRWGVSPKYEILVRSILGPAAGEYLATEEEFWEREEMNTKQCHQSENKMLCIKGNLLTTTIQEYNLLHLLVILRSLDTCIYLMECSIYTINLMECS